MKRMLMISIGLALVMATPFFMLQFIDFFVQIHGKWRFLFLLSCSLFCYTIFKNAEKYFS
jgi:hypothetical protein